MSMWLQLPDGSTFNLSVAQSISFGGRDGGTENEWVLLAQMPSGETVVLAQYHSPQAAQTAYSTIIDCLKQGARFMELKHP